MSVSAFLQKQVPLCIANVVFLWNSSEKCVSFVAGAKPTELSGLAVLLPKEVIENCPGDVIGCKVVLLSRTTGKAAECVCSGVCTPGIAAEVGPAVLAELGELPAGVSQPFIEYRVYPTVSSTLPS